MSIATVPDRSGDVTEPRARAWPWSGSVRLVGSRPLRLLVSSSVGSAALDGAWRPYGHDLRTEAVDLADHFRSSLGRVVRVLYSAADWRSGPARVRAANALVTLASFPHDDTRRVLLRMDPSRRNIQLLVVPPNWDDRAARHAKRIAADPANRKSAATILTDSGGQPGSGLAHWDDDGGQSASR